MALSKSETKQNVLKVKSYSIDQTEVLGHGAFGIVYKGIDTDKNTIAAKRIDGQKHPKVLTQDLDRFLQLDHPNVMKILDVEKNGKIVWMIMPFSQHGDLNHFYRTGHVSEEININVMKQIMAGISYLHSQDIVHRDIKPANILVASEIPLQLLLADFDVSKCLDPEVETSLMTSNVGTLAFKAPEFFQRTSPGQIEYHRNVDIYAAGLTFLAILQAKKGKKMLIPQIETPMDDTEFYTDSIGRLIAERIKYKVSELNIVTLNGPAEKLKWLISQMTCVNPEERLSAAEVLDKLRNLKTGHVMKIQLTCGKTFPVWGSMDVTAKNELLWVRVKKGTQYWIQVMDRLNGDVINEFKPMCNHNAYLNKHLRHPEYVLECCSTCEETHGYDNNTGECFLIYRVEEGCKIVTLCDGPGGCLLLLDQRGALLRLTWDQDKQETRFDYILKLHSEKLTIWALCYVECHGLLLCSVEGDHDYEIIAVRLETRNIVWNLFGQVEGHVIQPGSLTYDLDGNAYVSDRANNRILKIDSLNGEILSILLVEDGDEDIRFIDWSNTEPKLTVWRGYQIETYFVPVT